jgi:hypothetical protein
MTFLRRSARFSTMGRASLALGALALAACGIARFSIPYELAEQRVTGSPLGGLLGPVIDIPIDIDLSAETAARDTGPAQHVYLTGLSLAITPTAEPAGDTDDFDFIDTIDIFVESGAAGSTLPRLRVAHLDPVPTGARAISLELDGVDLIQYVREGAVLTSSAAGTVPPDDVTFDGHLTFAIDVL